MNKVNRSLKKLSTYDQIKALDPTDGNYEFFKIVGSYIDNYPDFSAGLRLQRKDGSIFDAPRRTLKEESVRLCRSFIMNDKK